MEKVYLTARYKLKPGTCPDEFREYITACIHTVARNCPNTLEYYWYCDDNEGEYILRAKFIDSIAVEHQFEHQKEKLFAIRDKVEIHVELYGNVDQRTCHMFSILNAKTFHFHQGISKDNGVSRKKYIV